MLVLLIALVTIILDQLSKYYVQYHMVLGDSIPIIPDVFHFTYILNPGAAFGILQNHRFFFIAVATVMICAIAYFYSQLPKGERSLDIGIALFGGGAVGNLIDRMQTGYVIDFFDFRIWPVFNVADIGICVGVALIIYTMVQSKTIRDEQSE